MNYADAERAIWQAMFDDHDLYCHQPWCVASEQLTPATSFLDLDGEPKGWACSTCTSAWQAANHRQIKVTPITDRMRAQWWATLSQRVVDGLNPQDQALLADLIAAHRGGSALPPHEPPARESAPPQPDLDPPRPLSLRAKILWWAIPAAVLALGITMVNLASMLTNQDIAAMTPPHWAALKGWGIAFIVISSLVLAGVAIATLISYSAVPSGGHDRASQQPRRVTDTASYWAAQAAPMTRQSVPVNDLVTAAALVGGEIFWHRQIRERQARVRDSALGVAPLNNAHAGMMRTTAMLGQLAAQRQAQWDARRQFQPDPMQAPFTGTPVSDIHGNVRYRKKPWP
jgi:hypothetical protein